MSDKNTLT